MTPPDSAIDMHKNPDAEQFTYHSPLTYPDLPNPDQL